MYSCTMPGGGGGGGARVRPIPNEEAVSVLNNFCSGIICTVMVWWSLGSFGVFQWTARPHDCHANRSNSQTSLPRAIGSPTDSRTFLSRAVG